MYKKKLAMDISNDKLDVSTEYGNDVSVGNVDPSEDSCNVSAVQVSKLPKKKKKRSQLFTPSKKMVRKKPKATTNGDGKEEPEENGGSENVEEADIEYEVQDIVDEKREGKVTLYRVRWKGYKPKDDSWLPKQDLGCPKILKKYQKIKNKTLEDTFNVEAILDHRRCQGVSYYLVHWQGFSSSDNSWQSKDKLNCPQLIKEYHDKADEALIKSEQLKKDAKEKVKSGNNEFEVEEIVGHKLKKGISTYKVRWLGWDAKDDTWVPEAELHCQDLIRAFEKRTKKEEKEKAKKRKIKHKCGDSDDSDSDYGKKKKTSKDYFVVDRILNSKMNKKGKFDFFVSWKGYGVEDNTWIPEEDLNCKELVDEFFGKNKMSLAARRKMDGTDKIAYVPSTMIRQPFERKTKNSGGIRPGTLKARVSKKSA